METTAETAVQTVVVLSVPVRSLRAASLHSASKDIRNYLCSVVVEVDGMGGYKIVATNGHTLLCIDGEPNEAPHGEQHTIIIANETLLPFLKTIKMKDAELHIKYRPGYKQNGGSLTLSYGETEIATRAFDGRFPDWKRIMPDDKPADKSPGQFNPDYLVKFQRSAELLAGKKGGCPAITVHHAGPHGAALVTHCNVPTMKGVIMPVRQ